MNTEGMMGNVIGYRRRKPVIDLNAPPAEIRDHDGTSSQAVPPTLIDVELLDDDVIESSPRAFAEAKSKSRRRRAIVVDLDSGPTTRHATSGRSRRQRIPSNQTVINCDRYINLESIGNKKKEDVPKPPPQPKEPTFACPICMGPLSEEMSTKCGHIFCKNCIKTAISVQPKSKAKCPTCRRRVTMKELIRVFLPTTSQNDGLGD